MSVILFILKLIGIILLVLLGMILLLVFLVLLVPVRYQISGQLEDEITIHAKADWLLHLISFHADYREKEFDSGLYIFGIRLKARKKSALEEAEFEDNEKETEEEDTVVVESSTRHAAKVRATADDSQTDVPVREDVGVEQEHGGHQRRSPFNQILMKIQSQIRRFSEILRRIKEGIPKLIKNASSLKDIITDEANKNVLFAVFAELKYLLGHFKFRKLSTDLRFSAGDPAATGQALGILSMFPVLYQYQVCITPDFESEEFYAKGVFELKGRMRAIHFVVSLVRLWKKKDIRVLVKKLLDR